MNIQKKILLAFSMLSLVSLTVIAVFSINNSISIIRSEVENSLNAIVDEKVHLIQNYIFRKKQEVSTLSLVPVISTALIDYKDSFKMGVNDTSYQKVDNTYRKVLSQLREQLKNYDLFLISPEGDIVFSDLKEADFSTNLFTGPYRNTNFASTFKSAILGKKTIISTFDFYTPSQFEKNGLNLDAEGVGHQSQSAFVATPVTKNGVLLGVLAIQLNSNDYFYLAADYEGLRKTGEIVISQKIGDNAVVIAPLRLRENAAFNLRFTMGSKDAIPIQQSVQGGSGSGLSIGYESSEILAAWRYIPEFSWGVVVKIDAKEAFQSAEELKYHFIIVGGIILVLSIIVSLMLSMQLSKPILALVSVTDKVARGDFAQKIEITSNDEIGLLAKSFNHMLVAKRADDLLIKNNELNMRAYLQEVERYKFAMDEHAIISSSDTKGNITYINKKFTEVSGYSEKELIGYNHRIINSKHHSSDFFKEMYQTIAAGKVWKADIRNRKKNGGYYWVSTTIVPFLNDQNKPILYMAMRTEITENINNINRIASVKDQLLEQVEKLSQVNQELDQFAYVASHDLKSPLNGIGQLASWIEEDCNALLPDESKEHLKLLKSRSKRMMNLLNDLLDYSRVGRQQHKVETFSLSEVVADIFDLHGDRKTFKCCSSELAVTLQKTPFEMVLRNLISNAIKHHDKPNGKITVTGEKQKLNYIFTIEDDGPGIPPELHEKALEMFQTLQSRDKKEGSGMGLAIVKKMVEHHGGEFEIVSRAGRGSVFVVKWPVASASS